MVVGVDNGLDVVPGLAVLAEDEDPVRDAVGELRLLGPQVGQGAVAVRLGIVGRQVPHVEVGAGGVRADGGAADVRAGVEGAVLQRRDLQQLGAHHRPEHLAPGLDVRGDGGLLGVQGLVVVQKGGGDNGGVGEVPLVQAQLIEPAQHPVGQLAPQLAPLDLLAPREGGLVEGHRHQVPGVDVPGAGDDLHRRISPYIHLADPHVVGVGMADQGEHPAHHHVGDLFSQVVGQLYLGAGEGHGLGELLVIGVNGDELAEPLSA